MPTPLDEDFEGESAARFNALVPGILLLVAVGGAIDLVLDRPQSWLSLHVLVEVAIMVTSLAFSAILWRSWRRSEKRLAELILRRPHPHDDAAHVPVLTIRFVRVLFVRVLERTVSGTIAPYRSPDYDCLVRPMFRGEINGDRIAGDFVTENAADASVRERGTWSANRQRSPDAP